MKQIVIVYSYIKKASPPARGRGLKQINKITLTEAKKVAPRAGAWIETEDAPQQLNAVTGRPPRGGVD